MWPKLDITTNADCRYTEAVQKATRKNGSIVVYVEICGGSRGSYKLEGAFTVEIRDVYLEKYRFYNRGWA